MHVQEASSLPPNSRPSVAIIRPLFFELLHSLFVIRQVPSGLPCEMLLLGITLPLYPVLMSGPVNTNVVDRLDKVVGRTS